VRGHFEFIVHDLTDSPVEFAVQSLSNRLTATSDSSRRLPWPDQPVGLSFVITDLDVGGAERALVSLATRLDRRRWRPSVICLSGEGELAESLRSLDVPCRCLAVNPWHPLFAVARLAWAMRAQQPALVQSFLFHANLAAKLAAPFAGCPWVVGGLRVAERRRNWHVSLDRLTYRLSAGSVCVSEGVWRFSEMSGLPADRLLVIPNGIDPGPYDRAVPIRRGELGIPEEAHLALFVGRLDPQKGLPDLIDAVEWVCVRSPEWHLAIVGDGPDRDWLSTRLRSQDGISNHPSLAGRVHWLGRRSDVPRLLKTANILVLPSHWEGMPNVVLEAMAAGLSVVATRVEGTEDLVVDGQTGWLVPPSDPMALGRALLQAAQNPERCRTYGEAGRYRVEKFFTPDRVVEAYERVWAALLGYQLP